MNAPQDPHPRDAIELSSTDPDAITHTTEPSNTDTATTLRGSSDDSSKADTITFLTTQVISPPRSDSPDTGSLPTAPPRETLRVVALSSETPPPSLPDSEIAPTGRLRTGVISTNTPPPSPQINPLDTVLPPIDHATIRAAEHARADAFMAELVGPDRWAEILAGRRARNVAVAAGNRRPRGTKRWVLALAVTLLVGVALLIVGGVGIWKATKARSGDGG